MVVINSSTSNTDSSNSSSGCSVTILVVEALAVYILGKFGSSSYVSRVDEIVVVVEQL